MNICVWTVSQWTFRLELGTRLALNPFSPPFNHKEIVWLRANSDMPHYLLLQVSFRVTYPPGFENWRRDELADFKSTRYGNVAHLYLFSHIWSTGVGLLIRREDFYFCTWYLWPSRVEWKYNFDGHLLSLLWKALETLDFWYVIRWNDMNWSRICMFAAVADMLTDAAAVLGGQETLRLLAQPLLEVFISPFKCHVTCPW